MNNFRRLLSLCFVLFPTQVGAQLPSENVELVGVVSEFSSKYDGRKIEFEYPPKRKIWISRDGATGQSYFPALSTTNWRLIYWNKKYCLNVSNNVVGSEPSSFLCTAVDSSLSAGFGEMGGFLLGKDYTQFASYKDVIASSDVSVETLRFGKHGEYQSLICESEFGRLEFGIEEQRLLFVAKWLRPNMIVKRADGKTEAFDVKDEWRIIFGPIVYDSDGFPVSAKHEAHRYGKDGSLAEVKNGPHWKILSHSELKAGDLSAERLNIEAFGIPKKLGAHVDSPVPYELRDGRLVKLVDGRSEKIVQESGFRKPSFWSRWMYPLIAAVPLVFAAIVWWWRK